MFGLQKGEPLAMPCYSRSRKLNVLGFLSRYGKLIYHTTENRVNTDVVIETFDHFINVQPRDKLTVIYLDKASFYRGQRFQGKCHEWLIMERVTKINYYLHYSSI